MSTQINITVGDKALLDAAKQQQGANRQAQLQKEANLRLEAQATTARTTAIAAQGRDANGNLITGAPFAQPQIDRRPAANRLGGLPHVLLIPTANYQDYGGTLTGFVERARNAKDVRFTRFDPQDDTIYTYGRGMAPGQFVAGGGPDGSNCLETKFNGQNGFLQQYTGLSYAVVNEFQYDALYNAVDYREWPLRLWTDNEIVVPTSKYVLSDCKAYTVEWFFRFGNDTLGAGTEVLGTFFTSNDSRTITLNAAFGGLVISMEIGPTATRMRDSGANPFPWVIDDKLRFRNFSILDSSQTTNTAPDAYNYALPENIIAPGLIQSLAPAYSDVLYIIQENEGGYVNGEYVGYEDTFFPDGFDSNGWYHFACVRSSQGLYSIYIDGQTICTGITVKESWAEVYGATPITGDIRMEVNTSFSSTMPGYLHSALHGYRFTPKALYSANFTPPPSITSFA